MAATDQTYRNQRTLDVVFAVSCVLMLLATLWMFWQDYDRPYKHVQREFRNVEEAMNEHQMIAQMPSKEDIEAARKKVAEAKRDYEAEHDKLRGTERRLMAERDLADNRYRSIKADYDSKTSLYNIAIEHYGRAEGAEKEAHRKEADDLRKELDQLQTELASAQAKLDEIDGQIRTEITEKLDQPQRRVNLAEDELKKLTASFDRYAKTTAQRRWKFGDAFRALPIIDAFESPTKIKQLWLPDLTIDYGGFKDVPRYDRCISCHLGIDRGNYDRAALTRLTRPPDAIQKDIDKAREANKPEEVKRLEAEKERAAKMQERLDEAHKVFTERQKAGENLGFDPSDLPDKVRWLNLTRGQITQFAAHPRLDLFVDANSPHPMEKFGCTSCHNGQGSATDFVLAAHSPNNAVQEEEWHKEYNWGHSHFWDFPMLSNRFIESSCLKCHHEVTDLIRQGSKQEAPKLLRGYELIRENGCFGCHEISGVKSGRQVGPDLRLEPQPALEYQTPSEQDKAKSDPLNLPGQYRKVGPSLRRIAEKTNSDWVRKWVHSPRGFRPDTKMPHFYGLSNNSPGSPDLPDDQKHFPAAEIAGIAHYLLAESKANLEGKDSTRATLEKVFKPLQDALKTGPLEDRKWKDLTDACRRLADVGLISVPANANEINRLLGRQRHLQERLQELHRKQNLTDDEKKEVEDAARELDEVTDKFTSAVRVVPLAKRLTDEEGKPVDLPKKGDAARGRKLFTERGCLACHSHDGTARAGDGVNAAPSEANFGPNLSRIAAKIAPEVAGEKDMEEAKRRWVVQWVMNPTIYHPRTRMPVTHLSPQDAADVAEWLLGQKVTDWEDKGPGEAEHKDLVALARLYLARAPGFTRADVDRTLPETGGELPGILDKRAEGLPADADEQKLVGKVSDDALRWYIGRKAINRLGCFGCHDIPGFESAKPIGTALNDWGKKDADRLAFEDVDIFARDNYHVVPLRNGPNNPTKPAADWHEQGGRPPYEKAYFEALKHHRREGFLHQKLMAPRSFDYHRLRTWDDRLRMPQFRFARGKKRDGEDDTAYQARMEFEEAEAREAVMTFILGLVAEPMPLKYLNRPNPDRLAEVKGHQVLEKFNCTGCHQVRPGVYEFKTNEAALKLLESAYSPDRNDHPFPGHNAWAGTTQATPDRMTVVGTNPTPNDADFERPVLLVRLTDALRFAGSDRVVRNLPAGNNVPIIPEDLTVRADPWGGHFTDLMIQYMKPKEADPDKARVILPPPLVREGERVQPNWLYGFLLNPPPVRPTGFMMLRMPKFNMSHEDARALVNYFSGVSRQRNPGAGVSAEYVEVRQRDDNYWRARTTEYIERLKTQKKFDDRLKEMDAAWDEAAKTGHGKVDKKDLRKQWEEGGAYAADAYRLLTDRELCLKCHNVGEVKTPQPQGPDLALANQRLRPEWLQKWLVKPDRMFAYKPGMPQPLPFDQPPGYQDRFIGSSFEQVTALRDVLMNLPNIADVPGNRSRAPVLTGGNK